jgi:hypothetical protein
VGYAIGRGPGVSAVARWLTARKEFPEEMA